MSPGFRRSKEQQLQLQPQPAGAGVPGVDRGQAPGGGPERLRPRGGQTDRIPTTQRSDQSDAQPFDRLLGKGTQVAPELLHPVEQLDARDGVAAYQCAQEGLDRLLVHKAEHLSHTIGGEGSGVGRQQLVEHGFGVTHASRGQARDQLYRLGLGGSTVSLEDRPQLSGDLLDGHAPEVEALHSRQDSRPDPVAVGRAEDEHHVVGRLFQRLEEDIPALLDALDLVDDEDLVLQIRRRGEDPWQQLAHVVDAVVRGGVHLADVQGPSFADSHARGASVTWLAVTQVGAVERLGQDSGERGLAGAARPHE